jgi:transposase-like protein
MGETDETISVCPVCDSSQIRANGSPAIRARMDAPTYRCEGCGDKFDETAHREPISSTQPKNGLAAQLAKPDAELATDGGESGGE